MEAKAKWQGRLTFTGSSDTGFTLPLGAAPEVGGDNDGFRPMELLAIGLAGCTAMDVISILMKKREQVTDFEVAVHAERTEKHPKVFTNAVIDYIVTGRQISEESLLRAIELSSQIYCPAHAMFEKVMPIKLHYHIYEDLAGGQRTLVKSGVFEAPQLMRT